MLSLVQLFENMMIHLVRKIPCLCSTSVLIAVEEDTSISLMCVHACVPISYRFLHASRKFVPKLMVVDMNAKMNGTNQGRCYKHVEFRLAPWFGERAKRVPKENSKVEKGEF